MLQNSEWEAFTLLSCYVFKKREKKRKNPGVCEETISCEFLESSEKDTTACCHRSGWIHLILKVLLVLNNINFNNNTTFSLSSEAAVLTALSFSYNNKQAGRREERRWLEEELGQSSATLSPPLCYEVSEPTVHCWPAIHSSQIHNTVPLKN